MKNKQEREILPKTFFEHFDKIITGKIPYFHNRELPEDLNGYIKQIEKYPDRNDKTALATHRDWLLLQVKLLNAEDGKLHRTIDILKSQKSKRDMDWLYQSGHSLREGETELNEKTLMSEWGLLTTQLMEFNYDFKASGSKIFRVEEQAFNELVNTEIRNLTDEFLNLPYQTIALHLPFNESLSIRGELAEWVYLSEFEEDNGKRIHICCISKETNFTVFEFSFTGGDIYSQVKAQILEKYASKRAYAEVKQLINFVLALILYINSESQDLRIVHPKVSPLVKHETSRLPVCKVGSTISINKDFKNVSLRTEGSGFEHHILKWLVRGHFRNQPVGEGRSERKIIWIRPFFKGKERESDIQAKPAIYKV